MAFKIPKFIKSIFGKNSIEREIPKLEKTTQEINKFAPELKGTSDNGAWGYLANVETEVEQGTPEIFHGANTHIPSRTIGPSAEEARQIYASPDNSFFGFLETSGARTEQGTREQFARSHYHGRSQTTGPSVYNIRQAHATTDNSFFGYLDAVQAEEEVGTSQIIGSGVHSKSKTVDNMVFPKKDTAGAKEESGNNTSTSSESIENSTNDTSTPKSDAPSSGSTETSTNNSDEKKTGTTKFVSSDDPRIGTTDSDGNFYIPDDISGGGISAGAKQHAYRKAYDKAAGAQKWQDEQIEKIKSAEQPQNMSDEEWQKVQQEQINAINKQAGKMRSDWSTMQKDSTKISPGLSDYVLGNPHTTAGVLGGGTLGYLALQLSDSRGQMTNQQLYGQDDLT